MLRSSLAMNLNKDEVQPLALSFLLPKISPGCPYYFAVALLFLAELPAYGQAIFLVSEKASPNSSRAARGRRRHYAQKPTADRGGRRDELVDGTIGDREYEVEQTTGEERRAERRAAVVGEKNDNVSTKFSEIKRSGSTDTKPKASSSSADDKASKRRAGALAFAYLSSSAPAGALGAPASKTRKLNMKILNTTAKKQTPTAYAHAAHGAPTAQPELPVAGHSPFLASDYGTFAAGGDRESSGRTGRDGEQTKKSNFIQRERRWRSQRMKIGTNQNKQERRMEAQRQAPSNQDQDDEPAAVMDAGVGEQGASPSPQPSNTPEPTTAAPTATAAPTTSPGTPTPASTTSTAAAPAPAPATLSPALVGTTAPPGVVNTNSVALTPGTTSSTSESSSSTPRPVVASTPAATSAGRTVAGPEQVGDASASSTSPPPATSSSTTAPPEPVDCVGTWNRLPSQCVLLSYPNNDVWRTPFGAMKMTYGIQREAENGGKQCPVMDGAVDLCVVAGSGTTTPVAGCECVPDVDCEGTTEWETECQDGMRSLVWKITQPNHGNGRACVAEGRETEEAWNNKVVERATCNGDDCRGSWKPWSRCQNGKRTRQYNVVSPRVNNGQPCPFRANYEVAEACGTACSGRWHFDHDAGNTGFQTAALSTAQRKQICALSNNRNRFSTFTRTYRHSPPATGGGRDCEIENNRQEIYFCEGNAPPQVVTGKPRTANIVLQQSSSVLKNNQTLLGNSSSQLLTKGDQADVDTSQTQQSAEGCSKPAILIPLMVGLIAVTFVIVILCTTCFKAPDDCLQMVFCCCGKGKNRNVQDQAAAKSGQAAAAALEASKAAAAAGAFGVSSHPSSAPAGAAATTRAPGVQGSYEVNLQSSGVSSSLMNASLASMERGARSSKNKASTTGKGKGKAGRRRLKKRAGSTMAAGLESSGGSTSGMYSGLDSSSPEEADGDTLRAGGSTFIQARSPVSRTGAAPAPTSSFLKDEVSTAKWEADGQSSLMMGGNKRVQSHQQSSAPEFLAVDSSAMSFEQKNHTGKILGLAAAPSGASSFSRSSSRSRKLQKSSGPRAKPPSTSVAGTGKMRIPIPEPAKGAGGR